MSYEAIWLVAVLFFDAYGRKVPNILIVAGLLGAATGLLAGSHDWVSAVIGGALAFFGLLPFYGVKLMGAGDVKFAGVLGLWHGAGIPLLEIMVLGSLLAGIHAVAVATMRNVQRKPWFTPVLVQASAIVPAPWRGRAAKWLSERSEARTESPRRTIPYAAYLAAGALWVLARA